MLRVQKRAEVTERPKRGAKNYMPWMLAGIQEGERMILRVPTFVILPRKTKEDKKIHLNLNTYRNMNYILNNQCKVAFHQAFKPEMAKYEQKFTSDKLKFTYTITAANKRKFDIANMLSVIDKFTCDALVKEGFMPDDNWQHLIEVCYKFGGITGERTCELLIEIA